jgi:hypothetical protein
MDLKLGASGQQKLGSHLPVEKGRDLIKRSYIETGMMKDDDGVIKHLNTFYVLNINICTYIPDM